MLVLLMDPTAKRARGTNKNRGDIRARLQLLSVNQGRNVAELRVINPQRRRRGEAREEHVVYAHTRGTTVVV